MPTQSLGSIVLYRTDDGLVGIDGCLPLGVAGDTFFAVCAAPGPARHWPRRPCECAVELIGKNAELVQLEAGQLASLQAEVPPESLPAVLAPAVAAGISVRDGVGIDRAPTSA